MEYMTTFYYVLKNKNGYVSHIKNSEVQYVKEISLAKCFATKMRARACTKSYKIRARLIKVAYNSKFEV